MHWGLHLEDLSKNIVQVQSEEVWALFLNLLFVIYSTILLLHPWRKKNNPILRKAPTFS